MIKTLIRYTATALTCVILAVSIPFTSYADTTNEYQQQMEERKSLPIQSNEIASCIFIVINNLSNCHWCRICHFNGNEYAYHSLCQEYS